MLRYLFALSIVLLYSFDTLAQTSGGPDPNSNSRIIPPPPNVASFIKVADVPVSNYNGTAQLSIPLYTLEAGDLKIPISASYYSNGLKVTEEASWIGFGWNLNAGGVIHQNIVGNPDNINASGTGYPSTDPLPIDMPGVNNIDIDEANRVEHGCTFLDSHFNFQYYYPTQLINDGSQLTGGDNEFDLFMYNFGGYSGKFIFPNYPTTDPVVLDRNNIQFKYDGANFTAITPDGTQYIFSIIGKTTTPPSSCFVSSPQPSMVSSSYYLSKIVSPDGNVATFIYKRYVSNSLPTLSQSYSVNQVGGSGSYLGNQGFVADFVYNIAYGSTSLSDNTTYNSSSTENYVLDSIKTANAIVKFNTSAREDVDQGVKLDNISIYRQGELTPFKSFAFGYSYFVGSSTFGDWTNDNNVVLGCLNQSSLNFTTPPALALRSERLKLNTIQVLGSNGAYMPPYQFYYDMSPMPYKTSLAQDLWGYFNGQQNHALLPDYNNIGYYDSNLPLSLTTINNKVLGVRKSVPQYLQAGMLKTIVNPTGGYTKITYEPNHFGNLPTLTNQIRDTLLAVTDAASGSQQLEFDVPDIGYTAVTQSSPNGAPYNPATITVMLVNPENGSTTPGTGGCAITQGFNAYNWVNPTSPDNANALYALIQMRDPASGNWIPAPQEDIYDVNNSIMQSGTICSAVFSKLLSPGHYRIVANYPDDRTGGLPEPSAFISVKYKYFAATSYPNYGGGLRVKSVSEYTDVNHMYNQKLFTYSSGKLMTKPIFYRNSLSFDLEERATISNNLPVAYLGQVNASCNGQIQTWPPQPMYYGELPVASLSLYSNPLLNYSYSASGAAVGYDTVKVDYSSDQQIGQTVYTYINTPDHVNYYPELLPGTPGGNHLLNGSLLSQTELKRNSDGSLSNIKQENNVWQVNDFQDYWAYKSELIQPYITNCTSSAPGVTPISGTSSYYNYIHFYPVKAGKVLLSQKTETFYDAPNYPYIVNTSYQYNAKNQLNYTVVSKSDGRINVQQIYYPGDYTVASGAIQTMQVKNMIDYPIETINYIPAQGGTAQVTKSAVYKQYYVHDNNIVSPQNTYEYNSVPPVAIAPSAPGNTMDSHYELRESYNYDQYGNLTSEHKTNGPITNYLWDYQNLYPVAKITNTNQADFAYTSFEADGKGNWNFTGSGTSDNTAPTGKYSFNLSGSPVSNSSLNSSKTYILSYWTKNSSPFTVAGTITGFPILVRSLNGWNFYEHKLTGVSSVSLSGSGFIDELRLYPQDAEVDSYTYEPLIGESSITDSKGNTAYYVYDGLQNLQSIKNLNGDITKMYTYQYAGYATPVGNDQLTQNVTRNNCAPGYAGGSVSYTVNANTYNSYISKAAANDLAQSEINTDGQAYANSNGGCAIAPCASANITTFVDNTSTVTITVDRASVGSLTQVLSVIDNTLGHQVAGQSIQSTTFTITSPQRGHSYSFIIQAYGPTCTNIASTTYTVTLP